MSLTIGTQTVADDIGSAAGWRFVDNGAGHSSANLKLYNASADEHTFVVSAAGTDGTPPEDVVIRKIVMPAGSSATFSTSNLDPSSVDSQYCELRCVGGDASTINLNYVLNVN